MRIISQHNLWFRGRPRYTNYKLQGRSMISVAPLLGRRDSSDPIALDQEMQWLHRYTGRDGSNFVYSLEWIRPGDVIDLNLNEVFLPAVEKTRAHWNLFYDPVLAVRQRDLSSDLPIDYSRPAIARALRSDIAYFAARYFDHPQYWHLNGKPVLYVWSVSTSLVNAEKLFEEARNLGIYLLGDVFGGRFEVPALDGYTGFVASTPEIQGRFTDVESILPIFREYYERFRDGEDHAPGDMIPALSPQYDDSDFQSILDGPQTRVLARDRGEVEAFMRLAKSSARGVDGQRHVFCGTTNNWAEGSTLLPTRPGEQPFADTSTGLLRIGDYGFEHLEALHRVFFPTQPRYTGPRIKQLDSGEVRFTDCDVLGRLRVRGAVDNRPDWLTGANLGPHENGLRTWRPERPRRVTLVFENLDGRRTKLKVKR